MDRILFISTYAGDAFASLGGLMASLPTGRGYHLSLFAAPAGANLPQSENLELEAANLLGIEHLSPRELLDQQHTLLESLPDVLERLVQELELGTIVWPHGLAQRESDLAVAQVISALQTQHRELRWLRYYEQPHVSKNRGQFPELAFARRVRGLAEVDEHPCMLSWRDNAKVLAQKHSAIACFPHLTDFAAMLPPREWLTAG